MNEASVTKSLVKALGEVMPGSVTIKINDLVTLGIPDLIHTWDKRSVWIEVKYLAPTCTVYPTQKIMMERLGQAGLAFWVEIHNTVEYKQTVIRKADGEFVNLYNGINVMFVANFVRAQIDYANGRL